MCGKVLDETLNRYLHCETAEAAHNLLLNFKYDSRNYSNNKQTGEIVTEWHS